MTISTPSIGGIVTDGTVTWKVCGGFISNTGSATVFGNDNYTLTSDNDTGAFFIRAGSGAGLWLSGANRSLGAHRGEFSLLAETNSVQYSIKGYTNGELLFAKRENGVYIWEYDLAGSAIVAKSINLNGYIKYASGLILQWGLGPYGVDKSSVIYPISFPHSHFTVQLTPIAATKDINMALVQLDAGNTNVSGFSAWINSTGANYRGLYWFAIGY